MYRITAAIAIILLSYTLVTSNVLVAGETIAPISLLLLAPTDELSESQKTFVKFAGYPQQFIKNFGVEDGQKRVNETWIYASLGLAESFINGQFVEEKSLGVSDPSFASGVLHPEDYRIGDKQANILAQHGFPLSIKSEVVWNGTMDIFIYSNVIFGFNNGALKSVIYHAN